MAKDRKNFVCQTCGSITSRWLGKCESCQTWNSISEELVDDTAFLGTFSSASDSNKALDRISVVKIHDVKQGTHENTNIRTGIKEFDHVCGDGLVPGSVLLIGGDPGVGKSTLLLQVADQVAQNSYHVVYISGEESVIQLKKRADRLECKSNTLYLSNNNDLKSILAFLLKNTHVGLVVIDSLQTIWIKDAGGTPGTVGQMRLCVHEIVHFAKTKNVTFIIIGHVTKDGQIAGPRVVEHMVDTVLYFEGEKTNHFRLLRGIKNRFGPTNEIGVFDMKKNGLVEVRNPSALFLEDKNIYSTGICIFAGLEGTRPIFVEIHTLLTRTSLPMPRRTVVGWDSARLSMILAVLESRCALRFGNLDIYLNVVGGFKINEPAADLAVAASIISSYYEKPLWRNCVFFGEVALSGALRSVSHMDTRIKEAEKLGFSDIVCPRFSNEKKQEIQKIMNIHMLTHLLSLVKEVQKISETREQDAVYEGIML